jgi:L-fuconolactonase
MFVWDNAWLALQHEPVLDPDLPIIDAHHHLWDHPGMTEYLYPDLLADTMSGHRIEGTVYMECTWGYRPDGPEHLQVVGETERVVELSPTPTDGQLPFIRGIVSRADMTLDTGLLTETLDAHIKAGEGRFRGIRHATAWDPDRRIGRAHSRPTDGLIETKAFKSGVRTLAQRNLSFDAWLYHPQILELVTLAQAVPECTIVLDHIGGPLGIGVYEGLRAQILEQWKYDLSDLAKCPNVVVKIGGIGMVNRGLGFEHRKQPPSSAELVAAWGGPIRFVIEEFGVDRCMFESNFPVDKMSCSYRTLWNAFKRIASGCSDAEKRALFSGTAIATYKLDSE